MTRLARTALAPNGLRTTPLAIQNAFDRTHRTLRVFHRRSTLATWWFTQGTSIAHPFARLSPRQLTKAASAPIELDHACTCLSAPCSRDQRCVRSVCATHIFKDEHPLLRVVPAGFTNWGVLEFTATSTRFGRRCFSAVPNCDVLGRVGRRESRPLTPPSSPEPPESSHSRTTPDDQDRFRQKPREELLVSTTRDACHR